MTMLAPICLIALLALSSGAEAQNLYRWVDKDGRVNYSDLPPPTDIRKVDQPRLGTSTIETSGLPYSTQKAVRDNPVTLYTATNCLQECKVARSFLAGRGIPYKETSIVTVEQGEEFKKLFGSDRVFIPSLTVANQKLRGFEEGDWNRLLDASGYPRIPIPRTAVSPAAESPPPGGPPPSPGN